MLSHCLLLDSTESSNKFVGMVIQILYVSIKSKEMNTKEVEKKG